MLFALLISLIYEGINFFGLTGFWYKVYIINMGSKQEPVVLNGKNYGMQVQYINTFIKSQGLWDFTKNVVNDLKYDH